MRNPLISIITPFVKNLNFLQDCIDSVQNQTYRNIEHIIVGDGAIEDPSSYIQGRNLRVKTVYKKIAKAGVSSARNYGIRKSSGEYIFPLDYDDVLESNCIEVLFKSAYRNNFDVTYSNFLMFKDTGAKLNSPPQHITPDIFYMNMVPGSSLVKKQSIVSAGMYDEETPSQEDYFLWCKMFDMGFTFGKVDEILWKYRIVEDSRSKSMTADRIERTNDYFTKIFNLDQKTSNKRLEHSYKAYGVGKKL